MKRQVSFGEYGPPFDLLSDMLFAFALAPAGPLRAAFPGVPFLSLGGRVPLAMWFSRVKEGVYTHPTTQTRARLGGPSEVLYNELNVVAALRRRAGFVPGIYATSTLTIEVGHRYGMPKQPTRMEVRVRAGRFSAALDDRGRRSYVSAILPGTGRVPGWFISRAWPRWSWPAFFPDGRHVRVRIDATPRVQVAYIDAGRLALKASWLPKPVALLPVGIYLPNQRMRLPPPPG
ncbi:MAG: hypothetical protein ACJ78Q_02425 [Chloroflexia bacterium]